MFLIFKSQAFIVIDILGTLPRAKIEKILVVVMTVRYVNRTRVILTLLAAAKHAAISSSFTESFHTV